MWTQGLGGAEQEVKAGGPFSAGDVHGRPQSHHLPHFPYSLLRHTAHSLSLDG